ncbi:scavenger receptor cysteine-rich type 1 protein M130-like [Trematomus bernacchii]|uniref:scavenger receptor cysteine-rich type 1 protein M130-like n=1 Tax=Trematomus bernacchii TaxID=40690 RepID=UPI00146DE674|nr:scavenger receptor cysteine-rich type 1 protein M130-like [Trematomus bernacchii]
MKPFESVCVRAEVELSRSRGSAEEETLSGCWGGTGLCSGRLEVKSDQSNQSNPSWSSVCESDFDQQDAQVVCRQLGCGAPSVLQGALYGEGEAPMWTKEFQCGGNESALLDCSSASERNTCSPGTAVSLTCSEPGGVKLEGGESRCAGDLEVKHQGEWRPVESSYPFWTLKSGSALRECAEASNQETTSSNYLLNLTCSGSCLI